MNRLSRATALKIAATVSFLLGVYSVVSALPYLVMGEEGMLQGGDGPGFFLIVAGFAFGILRIIGAYGTWMKQRWGILLTIAVNLVDALLAAPGILFAPDMEWKIAAYVGVIGGLLVVVLCLWRDPKQVVA